MPILKTRLHELRKEHNMQQAELAKLVGVRRETIGNFENGRYNPLIRFSFPKNQLFILIYPLQARFKNS